MRPWPFLLVLLLATPAVADPIVAGPRSSTAIRSTSAEPASAFMVSTLPKAVRPVRTRPARTTAAARRRAGSGRPHRQARRHLRSTGNRPLRARRSRVSRRRRRSERLDGPPGHAIAYRRYAEDYVNTEMTAKALRHGIWAGTFQDPSDWRREKRAAASTRGPRQ